MAKLERVGADHPQACQGGSNGACVYKSEPGSDRCSLHAGSAKSAASKRAEHRNYKLNALFGDRANQLADSPKIKSLTEEIGLMRVALETIFNAITDANSMLLYADRIEKMVKGIQNLVTTTQSLQEKNKELLGRETVMSIIDQILEKIILRIDDPDIVKALADDCYEVVLKATGGQ